MFFHHLYQLLNQNVFLIISRLSSEFNCGCSGNVEDFKQLVFPLVHFKLHVNGRNVNAVKNKGARTLNS